MSFEPKCTRHRDWINTDFPPPRSLIAVAVDFPMVPTTKGNGELITDLSPERPVLTKAQVMGVAGLAPANEAWLPSHISDVISVADTPRFCQCQCTLINRTGALPFLSFVPPRARRCHGLFRGRGRLRRTRGAIRKARQRFLEARFDDQGISRFQLVLFRKASMRPDRSGVPITDVLKFGKQSVAQFCRCISPQHGSGGIRNNLSIATRWCWLRKFVCGQPR